MKGKKINLSKQSIQEISIVFSKPIQISPPSTPEEIYTLYPKSSRSTINNKNTNVQSNCSNSQSILRKNNNLNLFYFPKSISPQKIKEKQIQISPLSLNKIKHDSFASQKSLRQPNRRATKLCSKVLQKYKNKYFI
ncbi:unnamed protein product [Paramecium sonneborni]|uniref:Uncharacterized protein n=1 Tax=Paramecium sonneborni TaxID=65129 RepID=A0A8S1Q6P0_9CILI|nr:unnamed protein product [Paramecium sonneborni]